MPHNKILRTRNILAGIFLAFLLLVHSAECSGFEDRPAFLWLEYGTKQDERDGSATQTIYITSSAESLTLAELTDLTAFYHDGRQTGEKQYYRIPVEQQDGRYFLRVNTSSRFFYHVVVTGSRQGEHFTAQTTFPLYADGMDKRIEQGRAMAKNTKVFPAIELDLSGNPYRTLMTGQTFRFLYKPVYSPGHAVREMQILDLRNKTSEKLLPDAAGIFSFTPPHDKRLDNGGYNAYKETIVYAEEAVGNEVYKTSMNFLLRRSYLAHNNLTHGLLLFFLAMAVSITVVLFRRRSFRYHGR
ncbi:MAG TPA: hypothetical protein PKA28_08345 [Methylomusa anaerophila]|uniref:hypothetical protein n=1 Tax=Methylomusa anaerophila TaxID=1930071 RepID=UPI000F84221F|nr:hypothetical protein [Methylomusa anaerophila]HML88443.1 hypothetical protein [Methylomusa anaerophila]